MNFEEIREYCLKKESVTEGFPFDETTLVFKVNNKMFALLDLEGEMGINLKSDPEKATELREKYSEIIPGYHMNKKYWNTVSLTGNLSDKLIFQLIDDSYNLIADSVKSKKVIKK